VPEKRRHGEENTKNANKLHRSGFPEEIITLKSWPLAIVVVLGGFFNVVSTYPGVRGQGPNKHRRNVFGVLFLEMSFDRCPSSAGVLCRVARPAMKATPILFFEANAGVFELGHLCRFHDPPFGRTFARRFLIPARDLHTPSLSRPGRIETDKREQDSQDNASQRSSYLMIRLR